MSIQVELNIVNMKSSAIIVLGVLVCAAAVVLAEERLQIGVTVRGFTISLMIL